MPKTGPVRPVRPVRKRGRFAAALLVATAATACAASEPIVAELMIPEVVDFQALMARLEPSSGEKALLVNFWATW